MDEWDREGFDVTPSIVPNCPSCLTAMEPTDFGSWVCGDCRLVFAGDEVAEAGWWVRVVGEDPETDSV